MKVEIEISDGVVRYLENNGGGLSVADIIGTVIEMWLSVEGCTGAMREEDWSLSSIVAYTKAQHGRWGEY